MTMYLSTALLFCAVASAAAQSVQVPLETATGWGAVQPPAGYKALRIQGKARVPVLVAARLFGDFGAHPSMFPRVVKAVDIVSCDGSTLKARYHTMFDPKPGKKAEVESLSTVRVTVAEDRIEFIWSSSDVTSSYVNAVWGRMLFATQRGPNGAETLVDYVSAIHPKNAAKGLLVETQKSVLTNDARYVIDRLLSLAKERSQSETVRTTGVASNIFNCP
jgi:hypothetical protein